MANTSEIANLITAVTELTQTVRDKMADIDQHVDVAEKDFQSFKSQLQSLIPAINLLPDPGFQNSPVGPGAPNQYLLANLYGGESTIEVVELTEQDKQEISQVLGNPNAFTPRNANAFWPSNDLPKKVVIKQTRKGTTRSSVRFQCRASNVASKPLYVPLVDMGGFTKKTGQSWKFGAIDGLKFSAGDIDDGKIFSAVMNDETTWEIFLPFLTVKFNAMVYTNIGGNR
ncbi:hypothetical protein GCM10007938_00640 [Vibrio zhanjiangensis]|uniref:Uncharacterized protein n=1 Tax=Vibrio zhanjiangensis TaxID=1046128 RepID=A0ABQ6ET11_9VIBR|nr:hypothetical protein [Vibrio zhanjiangensis]GLT16288.1 hypothetical protein GCM10007938_00640 [Vibrio zhanjiangensis]